MARKPGRRLIERLGAPPRQLLTQGLFDQLQLLVGVGALTGYLNREEPVEVRV
jgi:hypothetical protein